MDKQELAQIALKILGIYALLDSIQFVSGIINVFSFPVDSSLLRSFMFASMIVPFMILIWAGLFLLRKTEKISLKYFPKGQIENLNMKANDVQAIAFSIIGVVLIVTTIPKLSQLGVNAYALMDRAENIGADYKLERETIAFGINLFCRFIIGILLFVSGESLSNLWRKIVNRIKYETNLT